MVVKALPHVCGWVGSIRWIVSDESLMIPWDCSYNVKKKLNLCVCVRVETLPDMSSIPCPTTCQLFTAQKVCAALDQLHK